MMMLPSAGNGLHDAFHTISFMHWMISWAFNNRYIGSIQYVQLICNVLFRAINTIYFIQYLFCYAISPGFLKTDGSVEILKNKVWILFTYK